MAFQVDWERSASEIVAILHSAAGRNPHDRELSDLIGELSTQSHDFRTWRGRHDVRLHINCEITTAARRRRAASDLRERALASARWLTVLVYTPETGTPDEESIRPLDSWTATLDQDWPASSAADSPRGS